MSGEQAGAAIAAPGYLTLTCCAKSAEQTAVSAMRSASAWPSRAAASVRRADMCLCGAEEVPLLQAAPARRLAATTAGLAAGSMHALQGPSLLQLAARKLPAGGPGCKHKLANSPWRGSWLANSL